MKKHSGTIARTQAGFTLIELMIVIAIMALLGGFVTTRVMKNFEQAKVDATKIQIKQLGVVLDDFKRVCGFYPTTEQGLDALIKAPAGRECKHYDPEGFLNTKKVPQDAWGNDFIYTAHGHSYTLKSLGADGKEGGEGFDQDLSSDELD